MWYSAFIAGHLRPSIDAYDAYDRGCRGASWGGPGPSDLSCKQLYIGEIVRQSLTKNVFPAKAGIQRSADWIPAFAGMTDRDQTIYQTPDQVIR